MIDQNADGKVTKDEVLAAFASVDKNNDGTVTREELFQKISEGRPTPTAEKPPVAPGKSDGGGRPDRKRPDGGRGPRPESLFERFDKDHTGTLTKENVPERVWSRISKADSNSDGKISKDELETHVKKVRPGRGDAKPAEPKKEEPAEPKPEEPKPADSKPSAQVVPLDAGQAVSALFTEN